MRWGAWRSDTRQHVLYEAPARRTLPLVTTTRLAALITSAMAADNLSQGDVERRGGPKKQALSYLLTKWTGARSLDPETFEQLSKALGVSRRTLGRTAAVDMGLLPEDEALADSLALLTDALREQAGEREREAVVAAARAVWGVMRQYVDEPDRTVVRGRRGVGKSSAAALPAAARAATPEFKARRAAADADAQPDPEGPELGA